jgi:hypothetical protein
VRSETVVFEPGHFSGFDRGVECFQSFADLLDLEQNHLVLSWRVRRGKHDVGRTTTRVLDPR